MFLCASEEELVSACACVPDVLRWGNRWTSQFSKGRASTIAFVIRFVILSQIRIFQSIKTICQTVSRLEPKQRFRIAILDSLKFATALWPVAACRRLSHKAWRPDVPHFRSSCRRHFRWKSSLLETVVRFDRSTQRALHRAIHEKYSAQSFTVDDLTVRDSKSLRKTGPRASLQPCCRSSQTGPMHSRMSAMDQMAGGCENVEMDGGQLFIFGKKILSNVPKNIVLTPDADAGLANGAFLGFRSARKAHRQTLPIGVLQDLRFMCCFRFKIWWMTQRMGSFGSEVPLETQFLLIESEDESAADNNFEERKIYTVCLPLLEGAFRTSLQGNVQNELELCVESGDQSAQTSEGLHSMYINAGPNPFEVIEDAVRAVEGHLQTFARREKKKMPGILDYFGWCTWDAFYTDLTADRVLSGLKSLAEGGTPARFLIIDDGWQSVADEKPKNITVTQGTQYSSRLTSINESEKFSEGGKSSGLQHIVREAKQKLNIKYVYAWHALAGYWGGVQPGLAAMDQYKPTVTYPVHTPTILENQPDMEIDSLTVNGVGLVDPENVSKFYDELHRYLGEAGIDGVKVDAQAILETLGAAFGGRVSVTRKFQQALEASIASNFPDNGCIACMCHNTDTIYSSKQTAVVRASDDFWPRDPASHTIHIASVAYNSLFLGEFMQPDWDMYQSLHPAAEFHAAARAVGGCAVYVSDKPGQHDFDLLKKSVLPDGSVLRARLPGRPTRDSLFTDPARNGLSLLKIWNMNKFGGVIGAFNCQGAGWCKVDKKYAIHDTSPNTITSGIRALDVDYLAKAAGEEWNGDCAIYSHRGGELIRLPKSAVLPITLKVLEYEIFTVAPVKRLRPNLLFVPIGLIKMFNSGGAIQSLSYETYDHDLLQMFGTDGAIEPIEVLKTDSKCIIDCEAVPQATIKMTVHGCGEFGMYSSKEPLTVTVNSKQVPFMYDASSGFVKFVLAVPVAGHSWDVAVEL